MTDCVPPIVVLGNSRSGTSVTCGLLHQAGVFVGACKKPDVNNPKGYFENGALRRLARYNEVTWPRVKEILLYQGWQGEPWLVKNGPARAPVWQPLNPVFVLVRRDIEAIVQSQQTGRGVWSADRAKIERNEKILDGLDGFNVWPCELAKGNDDSFRALFEHLGLPWSPEFFDPELWHHG